MKHTTLSTIKTFGLWLLIVPPGIIYVYLNYPPQEFNLVTVSFFVILAFLTIYFPIMRNEKAIFLVMWITVPVFVKYGLFTEIIVMQFSVLAVLFTRTSRSSVLNRMMFNSLLFFILSVVAAFVFNLVGGVVGSLDFWSLIIAVFAYQIVHTALNELYIYSFIINAKKEYLYYSKEFIIKMGKVIIMVPFILVLYFLLQYIGVGATFLIAVPYFFITMLIRLISNTEKVNGDLQIASELGHSFSANLTDEKVIDEFIIKVTDIVSADYAFLYEYENEKLHLIRSYDNKEFIPIIQPEIIARGEGIVGSVLLKNTPVIYTRREEWKDQVEEFTRIGMESVISIPISRNKRTIGVLCLGASHKKAFQKYQLQIIDLLCSYFSVAIEKARYLQNIVVQMEYCALTKLHNYRYLNKKIESTMDLVKNGELQHLSVVLLDIDYFKKVNDSYGHQSGNDILCMMANLLKDNLPSNGIVCRYGGEEFVYLLPNVNKRDALTFAENIRLKIAQEQFEITPDLGEERNRKNVQITISVGVSSATEDTDEASLLLRNADRALYIGAKQLGRNRVAAYIR